MLASLEAAWAQAWEPPRRVNLSDWADANIILSSKDSAEAGPYRTDRTPYAREIADCLSADSPVDRVVLMAGAQIGKTRIGLNWIGYVIDAVPAPMLVVEPTVDLAKKVSKQRIATMIATTDSLTSKVAEARSRDSGNTMFEKEFPGGMLMITGANSAVGLRSMPIRFLFLDEIDGYPLDVEQEGDPVGLAEARTSTFARRKIFLTSTPTIKGLSRIEAEYEASDQRRYFLPCPDCGALDYIRWERIQWREEDPHEARLLCTACGVLIEERHKPQMLERGVWRALAPGPGKPAGFHISALYAPLGLGRRWGDIAAEFLRLKGDRQKLKRWVNTVLGDAWEERGDSIAAEDLKARLENYAAEVPSGVGVLTASVDVQGNRLELAVKGWGAGEESWLIALHQVHGDPAKEEPWFELDEMLKQTFTHVSGRKMLARAVAIDSGGLHTDHVYKFCKTRSTRRVEGELQHVYPIKGVAGAGREILGRPKSGNRYEVKLFPVGVDTAKDTIFSRLHRAEPGPGFMHLPAWVDAEYMAQLTAEKAIRRYKRGVGSVREYVKLRERNEGLDLEVYALAALHMLGRRTIADLGKLAAEADRPIDAPEPPQVPQSEIMQNPAPQNPRPADRWIAGRSSWIRKW